MPPLLLKCLILYHKWRQKYTYMYTFRILSVICIALFMVKNYIGEYSIKTRMNRQKHLHFGDVALKAQ